MTIDDNNQIKMKLNMDNVNNLEYMDLFIKEVLRMYPISSKYV
jgi:hypothetical protein